MADCGSAAATMLSISDHNKQECVRRLNLIIPEMPFIRSFADECLLERLLNLISLITTAFDDPTGLSPDPTLLYTNADRAATIRQWLCGHYTDQRLISALDFAAVEDRSRVTALIINILFKLRHSLKDVEQYLEDCQSFQEFDQQLSHITRWDRLLALVQLDANRWRAEARNYKVKYDESRKLIDKYQQNEIFNYNCNPRNQNLYKSRFAETLETDSDSDLRTRTTERETNDCVAEDIPTDCALEDELKDVKPVIKTEPIDHFEDCPLPSSEEPVLPCVETKFAVNDTGDHHLCVYCGHHFASIFQINLHLLQEHANVELGLREQVATIQVAKSASPLRPPTKPSNHKSANDEISSGDRVFKCRYKQCKQGFGHFSALKTHFLTHKPIFSRLTADIYRGCATEAVLNRIRELSVEPRKTPALQNTNGRNGQHKGWRHYQRSAVRTSALSAPLNAGVAKSRPKVVTKAKSLLKVNGTKHHFICNQTYVYPPLVNGSAAHQLLNSLPPLNGAVVPIVSTPDIFSHDSSDEDSELNCMQFEVKPDPKTHYLSSLGIRVVANHQ